MEKLKNLYMKYFSQLHYRNCAKTYKLITCKIWCIFLVIETSYNCLPVLLLITS